MGKSRLGPSVIPSSLPLRGDQGESRMPCCHLDSPSRKCGRMADIWAWDAFRTKGVFLKHAIWVPLNTDNLSAPWTTSALVGASELVCRFIISVTKNVVFWSAVILPLPCCSLQRLQMCALYIINNRRYIFSQYAFVSLYHFAMSVFFCQKAHATINVFRIKQWV